MSKAAQGVGYRWVPGTPRAPEPSRNGGLCAQQDPVSVSNGEQQRWTTDADIWPLQLCIQEHHTHTHRYPHTSYIHTHIYYTHTHRYSHTSYIHTCSHILHTHLWTQTHISLILVYTHIHTWVHTQHTCRCAHTCARTHTYPHIHIHACINYTHIYAHRHTSYTFMYTCILTHWVYVHSAHMQVCTHVCMHTPHTSHTHVHMHIYTYTVGTYTQHTYAGVHTHRGVHTCTYTSSPGSFLF